MTRETAHEIDAAAAQWAARVDRGTLSADDDLALQAWLAGDVRRPGAYARMRAIALHTERAKALGSQFDSADFRSIPATGWSRRRALMAGGGLAASVAAAAVGGILFVDAPQRIETRKGEIKVAPLADGSVVIVNTASRLSVGLSPHRRDVTLIRGEALFDVAKDSSRPFVVRAGDTLVRAVGTSFSVRHLPDQSVQVLVREGVVEVSQAGRGPPTPVRATLNTEVTAPPGNAPPVTRTITELELRRLLAWREDRLSFEGQTLGQAAAEFARYSDTRIIIDDPSLSREEIAGLFQANDPVGFSRAIAPVLNAHAVVGDGVVRIMR